jgi:hypothetical protein
MRFVNYLTELAMKVPDDLVINWNPTSMYAVVHTQETKINVSFSKSKTAGRYKVDFGVYNRGQARPLDIFMAVLQVIRDSIPKLQATSFWLLPADQKRSNIYKRMIKKFLPAGWTVKETEHPFDKDALTFLISK